MVSGSERSLFRIGSVCAAIGLKSLFCASVKSGGNSVSRTAGGGTLVGGSSPGLGSPIVGDRIGARLEVLPGWIVTSGCFFVSGFVGALAGIVASQSSNVSQESSCFPVDGEGDVFGFFSCATAPKPREGLFDFCRLLVGLGAAGCGDRLKSPSRSIVLLACVAAAAGVARVDVPSKSPKSSSFKSSSASNSTLGSADFLALMTGAGVHASCEGVEWATAKAKGSSCA